MAPPKLTLAALGGAAVALTLQRLRRKWLALPYAWRRSATRTELMRWILFDAAPEWATTERMHALRRAVACPAQSVSYANADPLLIVGGQGARDARARRNTSAHGDLDVVARPHELGEGVRRGRDVVTHDRRAGLFGVGELYRAVAVDLGEPGDARGRGARERRRPVSIDPLGGHTVGSEAAAAQRRGDGERATQVAILVDDEHV